MTTNEVRRLVGRPWRVVGNGKCWAYRIPVTAGTDVDGKVFCFRNGKVAKIETSVHL